MSKRNLIPLNDNDTTTRMSDSILDLSPFNANNRKKLDITKMMTVKEVKANPSKGIEGEEAYDITISSSAPTPITDEDAKVLFTLYKMCLDVKAETGDIGVERVMDADFVKVKFDLRGMTKFITGRTDSEKRTRVYKSLEKLCATYIKIETPSEKISTHWISKVKLKKDTQTATVFVSREILTIASAGRVFDLGMAMKFRGNTFLLYLMMQMRKHNKGSKKKPKYVYWDYISYADVVKALNIGDMTRADKQRAVIVKCFKELAEAGLPKYELFYDKGYLRKTRLSLKKG